MRRVRLICVAFGLAFLLGDLCASVIGQSRVWHSSDGREIVATALEIDTAERTVRLERNDGMRFTIEWSRLSDADRTILEDAVQPVAQKSDVNEEVVESIQLDANTPEMPDKFVLKGVPMVVQKGNFCVPASATMIAGFHDIETDQDQVAELSSEMSASNRGTYPSDMLLAMQKLGFEGRSLHWKDEAEFFDGALEQIRSSLVNDGPVYVSFRSGVFGQMGHGCVIVGYHHRKEEMYFYNPWGNEFTTSYEDLGRDGRGVVFIEPPKPAPVATEAYVERIRSIVPSFDGDFLQLATILENSEQAHELVWCSRRDSRDDKSFARNTARDDGRMILELSFERNPAVLIPYSENGVTTRYQFVTRPPEGGARFLVRSIDEDGWSEPELQTLGSLTRNWVTAFDSPNGGEKVWELPMIELHPVPSL